ncbi:polysaccharide lyase 8 family protein [Nonomuraea sp. NN258]|uniref:polysaccharide lyase family 8 super-sandwich domain-containing protein n=1 Tax=Nonomuraea antri TaxID=2730852 RepID=UPI0015685C19|nr:polysaccharide lyase family 8 super-sandwich domain-containing protein [Nonomuraea antri]NRQ37509.1 polysaccharide lyase 8 family protein [Nonomuraea antri]
MRRALALLALLCPLIVGVGVTPAFADPVPDTISRWRVLLTGGQAYDPAGPDLAAAIGRLDAEAEQHRSTMVTSPSRTHLWPDLSTTHIDDTATSTARLRVMATALQTKGSRFAGDAALRDMIVAGLTWIHTHRYNTSKSETSWWSWEIGAPDRLVDVLMLLGDAVPGDVRTGLLAAIAKFCPDPTTRTNQPSVTETGANRADKAYITVRRGLLLGDPSVIAMGRDALSQIFPSVTSGDGFYADGSFIQHTYFPYTGSYGTVLLSSLAKTMTLLAGSPWDVTDPNRANVFKWIFDSFEPVTFRGQMIAGVRGRSISRKLDDDYNQARRFIQSAVLLHPAASDSDKPRLAAMLRELIASGTAQPYLEYVGVGDIVAAHTVIAGAPRRGDLTLTKVFPSMDRLAVHRPGHLFTVSARSSRIAAYESGNGENLYGWYTSEGMTYLYSDGAQYTDGFWPTVDPYRLPGTTTATQESYPRTARDANWSSWRGPDAWVGGASLGTESSSFGMRFTAQQDPGTGRAIDLTGRKSWFTVGDVIVALGADITGTNVAAQTTVENRMNPGQVTADGGRAMDDLSGARWLHLAGTGGYLFPAGSDTLRGKQERRTGRWSDIGSDRPDQPGDQVSRDYATLWFDHGAGPRQASYAYYLLPGASADQTAAYAGQIAQGKGVRIADNSPAVQSVIKTEGVNTSLAATFWTCAQTAGLVRSHSGAGASLDLRKEGSELAIAVSDPTQRQSRLVFEVAREVRGIISADPRVQILSTTPTLRFAVDVTGSRGRSISLTAAVDPTARPKLSTAGCAGVKLPVVADTYVRDGSYAGQNFNATRLVVAKKSTGYTRASYLKLDLGDLAGTRPAAAELWLYGQVADSGGTTTKLSAYGVADSSWDETTMAWNNRPPNTSAHLGDITVSSPGWYRLDLTSYLATAPKTASLVLYGAGSGSLAVIFQDRESPENAPYLKIM